MMPFLRQEKTWRLRLLIALGDETPQISDLREVRDTNKSRLEHSDNIVGLRTASTTHNRDEMPA